MHYIKLKNMGWLDGSVTQNLWRRLTLTGFKHRFVCWHRAAHWFTSGYVRFLWSKATERIMAKKLKELTELLRNTKLICKACKYHSPCLLWISHCTTNHIPPIYQAKTKLELIILNYFSQSKQTHRSEFTVTEAMSTCCLPSCCFT